MSRTARKPPRSCGDSDIAAARFGTIPRFSCKFLRSGLEPAGAVSTLWMGNAIISNLRIDLHISATMAGVEKVPGRQRSLNSLPGKRLRKQGEQHIDSRETSRIPAPGRLARPDPWKGESDEDMAVEGGPGPDGRGNADGAGRTRPAV